MWLQCKTSCNNTNTITSICSLITFLCRAYSSGTWILRILVWLSLSFLPLKCWDVCSCTEWLWGFILLSEDWSIVFWNTCERGNWCSFPEQQLSFQSHFSLFLINKNCLGVLALKDYILQVQQQWPHRYFVSCPSKRGLISGAVLKMLCSWLNLTISFSLSEENTSSAGWADSRR